MVGAENQETEEWGKESRMLEEEEKGCEVPEATQRVVTKWTGCEQGASMPVVQEGLFSQWIYRDTEPGLQQKEGRAFPGSDSG